MNNTNNVSFSSYSITEASYIVNSYIEESFNDLQIKCLMVDNRSLQESGVRYFTEENDAGKQKLGDKIKQIIKTVWDVIVGIFKKIRDFFKDMIEKVKDFFSKIQQKFFGKKEYKKEESKAAENKDETKPETKSAEKKEESKKRPFNTEKLNSAQDEYRLHKVDQKELIRYMEDLDDKIFRKAIDKNISLYYDSDSFDKYAHYLSNAAEGIDQYNEKDDNDYALRTLDRVRKFLNAPLTALEMNTSSISKNLVLDCAFGNFTMFYKDVDRNFKYAEKTFDKLSKNSDKLEPQTLPVVKELLKLTTTCSKMYSNIMIHNSKELMKVVHYIYNNYDRDGVSVKESVDWSSIL